jgi:dolichol kinase
VKKEYQDEKKKYKTQNEVCPLLDKKEHTQQSIEQAIKESKSQSLDSKTIEKELNEEIKKEDPQNFIKASRSSLQLPRRIFHMINGGAVAVVYSFLTHSLAVHILGIFACILYIFEQIRINYPEYNKKLNKFYKYFLRAEEQLKESSMIPYVMGLLLTIISFPKMIAICSILTLALADPLSAIVGIKFGKKKIMKNKTFEGSMAFFVTCFFCLLIPLSLYSSNPFYKVFFVSILTSAMTSYVELLPLKIDDNLTIPIFCSFCLLVNGLAFGMVFT